MEPAIYLVDDDSLARESLNWLMESADLPVREFERGLDFLAQFDRRATGCVVLDVRMPDINGM